MDRHFGWSLDHQDDTRALIIKTWNKIGARRWARTQQSIFGRIEIPENAMTISKFSNDWGDGEPPMLVREALGKSGWVDWYDNTLIDVTAMPTMARLKKKLDARLKLLGQQEHHYQLYGSY